ncbi:MAG: acyl-CoA dehydrogenase family protein [Polyangiaceae bacterium]
MSGHEQGEPKELAEFRAEVKAWIAANKPAKPAFKLPLSFLEVESKEQFDYLREWQRKVYDAGYLGYDVPKEYGGQGVDRARFRVVGQELARSRAPFMVNLIALQWAGPTIMTYGTEEQKKAYLKGILSAEEIWCQGFSEPGSGSDLASLQTRAVKVDGGYRVTGHKVWTTLAHFAKYMILMARTDPAANKYSGISYFLFPMETEGVEIQPLVKLSGEGGFNQIVFDDAFMPSSALLGDEGQGWNIAMTTLMFERGANEGVGRERAAGFVERINTLTEVAKRQQRGGKPVSEDPVFRDRIVRAWIEAQAMALAAARSEAPQLNADRPLALPLMNKLVMSEWAQHVAELGCEMLGPEGALWVGDEHAPDGGDWPRAFMNSFGMTIGGGTSEILRNIIGERVLGLPKSK